MASEQSKKSATASSPLWTDSKIKSAVDCSTADFHIRTAP